MEILTTATETTIKELNVNHGAGVSEVKTYTGKGNNAVALDYLRLQSRGLHIWSHRAVDRLKILFRSQGIRMFEWEV